MDKGEGKREGGRKEDRGKEINMERRVEERGGEKREEEREKNRKRSKGHFIFFLNREIQTEINQTSSELDFHISIKVNLKLRMRGT